jgi:hypothetical protein
MLRNIAKGHIWQFGVTALPATWPFWHLKLKARVLFAADNGTPEGLAIDDPKKMHKLRRSICKGWRNKQWHGRMLAFLNAFRGQCLYQAATFRGARPRDRRSAGPFLVTGQHDAAKRSRCR